MAIHVETKKPKAAIFRQRGSVPEPLAIGPDALGFMFDCPESYETEIVDGIAVLCIEGPIEHKRGWFWDSYESIAERFHSAINDDNVSALVLKIDSPGGECSGLVETVRALRAIKERAGKPVYAYADESAYSAAYALATVADEIYLPASGGVGSIGVIHTLCDRVGMNEQIGVTVAVVTSGDQKADGHPDVAISKGVLARAQERVDGLAMLLFQVVAEARGVSPETIASLEAGSFYGAQAITAGLADGVMGFSDVVASARDIANGEKNMSRVLIATKAVTDARATLATAKSDDEKKIAAIKLRDAEKALVSAKAETVVTTTTETTAEDPPAEDNEEDDDEEDTEEEDAIAEEEDCEDASDATAATSKDVVALCRKITGKSTPAEMVGALQAMAHATTKVGELAAKVERLERASRSAQVDSLVASASKAGKIPKGLEAWAKELGRKSIKSLKAYLEAAPKVVATLEDGGLREPTPGGSGSAPTSDELKIAANLGISAERLAATKQQIAATLAAGKRGLIVH